MGVAQVLFVIWLSRAVEPAPTGVTVKATAACTDDVRFFSQRQMEEGANQLGEAIETANFDQCVDACCQEGNCNAITFEGMDEDGLSICKLYDCPDQEKCSKHLSENFVAGTAFLIFPSSSHTSTSVSVDEKSASSPSSDKQTASVTAGQRPPTPTTAQTVPDNPDKTTSSLAPTSPPPTTTVKLVVTRSQATPGTNDEDYTDLDELVTTIEHGPTTSEVEKRQPTTSELEQQSSSSSSSGAEAAENLFGKEQPSMPAEEDWLPSTTMVLAFCGIALFGILVLVLVYHLVRNKRRDYRALN